MDGDVKPNFDNPDGEVLSIEASYKYEDWFGIREIGQKIERKAQEIGQDLTLDNLTRGAGNCFPIAVLQQITRNEIFPNLDSKLKEIASSLNYREFRNKIAIFMIKSKLPHMLAYRKQVEEVTHIKWNRYCNKMVKNGEYVDSHFVQCTAWCLKMDIMILDKNATKAKPFMKISGNVDADVNLPNPPVLFIGLADEHYQSLLPILRIEDTQQDHMIQDQESTHESQMLQEEDTQPSQIGKMEKCPVCGIEKKRILQHINRNTVCKEAIGTDKLEEMKATSRKEKNRLNQTQQRVKRKAEDEDLFKETMKKQKAGQRQLERSLDEDKLKEKMTKQRAGHRQAERSLDENKLKEKMRTQKTGHRQAERSLDEDKLKEKMKLQKAEERSLKRLQNSELFKAKTRIQVAKWRKRENSQDRLKAFREGTLHGQTSYVFHVVNGCS